MEPAKSIIAMFGGPAKVARKFDLTVGAVSRWYTPAGQGGCGGLIPSGWVVKLCQWAKERKSPFLEPNTFFRGHV